MRGDRSFDWLRQADNDLLCARSALKDGFYAQCCFMCQQAAEKAITSIAYYRGAKAAIGHSLIKLCDELHINGSLREAAGVLDQFYLSARYPDALPGGAPYEAFSATQARQALELAGHFINAAHAERA